MMRLTSSAMDMPRRLASRFKYARCGSVNEIICLVIGQFDQEFRRQQGKFHQFFLGLCGGFLHLSLYVQRFCLKGSALYLIRQSKGVLKGKRDLLTREDSDGAMLRGRRAGAFFSHTRSIPQGIQCR